MAVKTTTHAAMRPIDGPKDRLDKLPAYQMGALKWALALDDGEREETPSKLKDYLPERRAPRAAKAVQE